MSDAVFQREVPLLLAELEASANAHDVDRHLALYSEDERLVFVAEAEVIRGWKALRERQRQWWDDGRATGTYRYIGEPVYAGLAPGLGVTTVLINARRPAGERLIAHSAIWRALPQGWRIVYAHESLAKPA